MLSFGLIDGLMNGHLVPFHSNRHDVSILVMSSLSFTG